MKYVLLVLALTGCATPAHVMQHNNKVVVCGGSSAGSLMGGAIGYNIQKQNDEKCRDELKQKGYKELSQ